MLPTDFDLLTQIGQGSQDALMALYGRYSSLVYSLALRTLRQPALAEEVTQDVFVKVWQQPQRWDPELGQFSSWLLTITRNAAIDRLRREQRHQTVELDPPATSTPANNPGLDHPLWYDGQVLRRLLYELPDEQRLLIELAFFQGYTHRELAERLDLPLGTVKTRLRSGMQRLRSLWIAVAESENP